MKTIITLFLTVLSFNVNIAQMRISDFFDTPVSIELIVKNNKRYDKIEGTPYTNPVFMNGQLGENKQIFLLRYNAESDFIELKFDEENIYVVPKEIKFSNIKIGTNNYKLSNYTDLKGQFVYGYLVEKTTDSISLMKREKIMIKPEKKPTTGYDSYEPSRFVNMNDEYYLKLKDNSVVAFPKNKKGILELFPTQKQAIEDFIKTNKTSFTNESSMIQLTQFIAGSMAE